MRWIVGQLGAAALCLGALAAFAPRVLFQGHPPGYEARAQGALRTLIAAQALYRSKPRALPLVRPATPPGRAELSDWIEAANLPRDPLARAFATRCVSSGQPLPAKALLVESLTRLCTNTERLGFEFAGSLDDLARTSCINTTLASGEHLGYRFALIRSNSLPEYLWLAVASPSLEISEHVSRHFAVNHTGVIHYDTNPIPLRADCQITLPALPVGK